MTDFRETQAITLSVDQIREITRLGQKALTAIATAHTNDLPPPVGVWQDMYDYINEIIVHKQVSGVPDAQAFWFSQAPFITGDKENVPSGYFVRDVTAVGFGAAGPQDPEVQAVSNAIGTAIFTSITKTGHLPAFWKQLTLDIYSALGGSNGPPYPYPQLVIASWGGTFYYWNAPYDPNGDINQTSPPPDPISKYVLANPSANQTFITNYSQAIADTVTHFQSTIPQINQILPSVIGTIDGVQNIWSSGWQGKLDIVELIQQTIVDYVAKGQAAAPLESALINFVQSQLGLYVGEGSTNIAAGGGSAVLVGGQGIGSAGNDTLAGGGGNDTFLVNLPATGSVTETINDGLGLGQIVVSSNGQFVTLGGSAAHPLTAVAGQQNTWEDTGGTLYAYNQSNNQLVISGGYLGSGNELVVNNFNIGLATGVDPYSGKAEGFIGIFLPQGINLTAGASAGTGTPANFSAGSAQSYTISMDAPSGSAQTIRVALSGLPAGDFEVFEGQTTVAINADGTFDISLAAGQTNVSFTLSNTVPLGSNGTLVLTASLANSDSTNPSPVTSGPLKIDYVGAPSDTSTPPQGFGTPPSTYASSTDRPANCKRLEWRSAAGRGRSNDRRGRAFDCFYLCQSARGRGIVVADDARSI